jgi:hypothetical protein
MSKKKVFEPKQCYRCKEEFTATSPRQIFCGVKCQREYHKEIRRVPNENKKGRYEVDNLLKKKPNEVPHEFKLEILEFLRDCKRKAYYLDPVDSYRLIHYFVEVFGIWILNKLEIETELYFYLVKLTKYIKKEFDLEKI